MQVRLDQRAGRNWRQCGGRLNRCGTIVAQDGRVDPIRIPSCADVRVRTDPVVTDRLVCVQLQWHSDTRSMCFAQKYAHHKGVTLAGEDLKLIDSQGLVVGGINLDDGHIVVVDAKEPVWITGYRHQTETIAIRQRSVSSSRQ